jgi:hypothetical protein
MLAQAMLVLGYSLMCPELKPNQTMKTITVLNCGSLALATLFATAVVPALGQSTFVIQHTGATDPVTEGFQNLGPGSGYPVINDMGHNAWATPGISNLSVFYKYVLTPQQQAESAGADWILSANLRITTTNAFPIFSLNLEGYNGGYGLGFGSASNGDQYVEYAPGSSGRVTLPGSNYNDYELRYDASAEAVSLWINGIEYANNIFTNQHATYLQEVGWMSGYYDSQNASANWNLLSLTIPEPSSSAVILLGSGVLVFVLKRRRFRS